MDYKQIAKLAKENNPLIHLITSFTIINCIRMLWIKSKKTDKTPLLAYLKKDLSVNKYHAIELLSIITQLPIDDLTEQLLNQLQSLTSQTTTYVQDDFTISQMKKFYSELLVHGENRQQKLWQEMDN